MDQKTRELIGKMLGRLWSDNDAEVLAGVRAIKKRTTHAELVQVLSAVPRSAGGLGVPEWMRPTRRTPTPEPAHAGTVDEKIQQIREARLTGSHAGFLESIAGTCERDLDKVQIMLLRALHRRARVALRRRRR